MQAANEPVSYIRWHAKGLELHELFLKCISEAHHTVLDVAKLRKVLPELLLANVALRWGANFRF